MHATADASLEGTISRLRRTANREDCLRLAYEILADRFHGSRHLTVLRFWQVFIADPETLWERPGFLHCTSFNLLLRTLLLRSAHFSSLDIEARWTLLWGFSPHQYMCVRIGSEWVAVDLWGHRYGIVLGDYTHGFHHSSKPQRALRR